MADNDQNDEYKFEELESYDNSLDNMDHDFGDASTTEQTPPPPKKDVKRNALIVLGVVFGLMLLYKLIGGLFSTRKPEAAPMQPTPIAEVTPQPPQAAPVQPIAPVVQEVPSELKQKVDAIDTNQQNMQSQVASMNDQINNVSNSVSNLNTQIAQLNQTMTELSNQLKSQSDEIKVLMDRTKPKPIVRPVRSRQMQQGTVYHINAIIPGRAWLIGTNGSTLTVREGTRISGYGVVKLIDSLEGRVLTSSGRIIRFSQNDS